MKRAAAALALLAACDGGNDDARRPRDRAAAVHIRFRDAMPAPAPCGPARLTVHASGVDFDWNGLTLHLTTDCPTLQAAFTTSHAGDTLILAADPEVQHGVVVSVLDCARSRFAKVSLQLTR